MKRGLFLFKSLNGKIMTQNHFKPFATGANAIVQTQEDYEKSTAVKEGFRKGLARSNEVNI